MARSSHSLTKNTGVQPAGTFKTTQANRHHWGSLKASGVRSLQPPLSQRPACLGPPSAARLSEPDTGWRATDAVAPGQS